MSLEDIVQQSINIEHKGSISNIIKDIVKTVLNPYDGVKDKLSRCRRKKNEAKNAENCKVEGKRRC